MVSLRTALRQKMIATLPTPASGEMVLGFKNDGNLYQKTSGGLETPVGGSGATGPQGPTGTPGTGSEAGYSERLTAFTTTNTTAYSTVSTAIISSLSVTVIGTGRPFRIEFFCPAMAHSANAGVQSYFVINGVAAAATSPNLNWATPQATGGLMVRRMILTNGTSYTFTVGLQGLAAGTTTAFIGGNASPLWIAVDQK